MARLHADLMDLLPASPDALRDRTLLAGDPAAMDRLDIRTPAGYIQLARDADGAWRLFQPFTARADSATVMALIEKLLAGRIAHFVQDGVGDLAPYGLDSQGAITVVLNTGTVNGTQMLSLGDALPNAPTLVYARLQAEDSIYAVPAELREALNIRPDDLRDRRLPALPLSSVARLRMEENESVLEFERDADGRWIMTMPMQAPADDEAVNSLLRAWGELPLAPLTARPLPRMPRCPGCFGSKCAMPKRHRCRSAWDPIRRSRIRFYSKRTVRRPGLRPRPPACLTHRWIPSCTVPGTFSGFHPLTWKRSS